MGGSWTAREFPLVSAIGYTMIGDIRLPIDEMTSLILRAEGQMVWCDAGLKSRAGGFLDHIDPG